MTSTDAVVDVVIRPATDADADAIADVMLASREGAVATGSMPPSVHPASGMVRHVREDVLPHREVWVAQRAADPDEAEVVAVLALDQSWLDDLYVIPSAAGQGIGSALLKVAQARRPEGFELWVFEVNASARRFYERHAMVEVERTDGAGNEERAPDCRYAWRP